MQTLEKKKFVLYTNTGYGEPTLKLVEESFLTRENGFHPPEVRDILALEVDEVYRFSSSIDKYPRLWRVK